MSKQDRQGVRHPAELERKYVFGQRFSNQEKSNAAQNKQIDQLGQSMSQNASDTNASLVALAASIETLEANVFALQGADIAMGERMTAAEGVNETQDETISGLAGRLQSLETKVAELTARVAALEGKG